MIQEVIEIEISKIPINKSINYYFYEILIFDFRNFLIFSIAKILFSFL